MFEVITLLIAAAVSVSIIVYTYRKEEKLMDNLSEMIHAAINGTFAERHFDESRMSALENTLAEYLRASELHKQKASDEKDRIKTLIADISHQTKTPIANLLLYSELLQEMELPEEAQKNVSEIHSQTERLNFLIASLIKLSRLENGIVTLHPMPGDIRALSEEVMRRYNGKAEQKGLKLRVEAASTEVADRMALFDAKWTEEALGNIVDNAIKYTTSGTVTLRTTLFEMFVCIEVQDTGCGIPEKEVSKIFSRFYRGAGHAAEEGVGIGLYLARQIISEENGYIRVSSAPGQGSIFSIFLPAVPEADSVSYSERAADPSRENPPMSEKQ
ncbi:MAG: sensor histidine kinase [Bilifractor sp.]